MNTPASQRNPIDRLAEEFAARLRNGSHPSIDEYAAAHPDLEQDIRKLFPMLEALEQAAPDRKPRSTIDRGKSLVGQCLDNYRLLRVIGRGGMGVVYEAVDESLGRHVAVKVLPAASQLDPSFVARFQREAKAVARLHHTNIVPVFGFGETGGLYYFVMQLIQGRGFDEVLTELRRFHDFETGAHHSDTSGQTHASDRSDTPDPSATSERSDRLEMSGAISFPLLGSDYWRNVARVGLQTADALAYAHGQGILHRDIKPANLLLDQTGTVWVTDFGLAKTKDQRDLTRTGDVIGTLRYMAPEGLSGVSSVHSDICSLGLTLYEMAALRPAYIQSDHRSLMREIELGVPKQLTRVRPSIPRDLETIIHKSIAGDRRERYQSAEAMADDLRRFLSDKPVLARRASITEQLVRWCRRNPQLAGLSAAVMGLLIVLSASLTLLAYSQNRHGKELSLEVDRAGRAERAAIESEELAKRRLLEAHHNQAKAIASGNSAGRRFDSLTALAQAAALLDEVDLTHDQMTTATLQLRNSAIASFGLVDLGRTRRLARSQRVIDFSSDLTRYAVWDGARILVRRVDDDGTFTELPCTSLPMFGEFSFDGRFLLVLVIPGEPARTMILWDLSTGKHVFALDFTRRGARAFAAEFHPNGRELVVSKQLGVLEFFNLAQSEFTRSVELSEDAELCCISPDGRRVAALTNNNVYLANLESGTVDHVLSHASYVFDAAWSPNGRTLAVACVDYRVHLWDTRSGEYQAQLSGHQAEVIDVAFNQSGTLIASSGWDGMTRLWDGQTGDPIVGTEGAFNRFSQDGRRLAFHYQRQGVDDEPGIWEVGGNRELVTLHEPPCPGKGPVFAHVDPTNRLLVTCGGDGVRLWDVNQHIHLAHLIGEEGEDNPTFGSVFTADGRALITSGIRGALVWPVRWETRADAHVAHIGPPTRLPIGGATQYLAQTPNGSKLAIVKAPYAYLLEPSESGYDIKGKIRFGNTIIRPSLSADGRWLVGKRSRGQPFGVWETTTKQMAHVFPAEVGESLGCFSPDGRYLATNNWQACRVWQVGTWELVHEFRVDAQLSHPVAFSHDSRHLAFIDRTWRQIRLADVRTGFELARFAAPASRTLWYVCFSPDGSKLVATTHSHMTYVWDLAAIRSELRGIGLDWPRPAIIQTATHGLPVQVVASRHR